MSDADFYALPAMEQVRYAMNRPVPTVAPELADQRLLKVLTEPPLARLLPEQVEKDFRIAYHPERLEWLGDRVCYGMAGEVLFALAPLEEKSQSKPGLRSLGFEVDRLVTNEMHGKLSREFKLSERIACFSGYKGPADAWEAYLAALLISNGRRALLEFYAPLLRRGYLMIQFLDRFDRLPPVVTTSTRSLQSSLSSLSSPAAKVAPPAFTKSHSKRDDASPAGGAAAAVAAAVAKAAPPPTKASSKPSVKTPPRPSPPSLLEQIQAAQDFVPTPKKLSKLKPTKVSLTVPESSDILIDYLRFLDSKNVGFAFVWRPGSLALSVAGFRPFVAPCSRRPTRQAEATQLIVNKLKSAALIRVTKPTAASATGAALTAVKASSKSGEPTGGSSKVKTALAAGSSPAPALTDLDVARRKGFVPLRFDSAKDARLRFEDVLKEKKINYTVRAGRGFEVLRVPSFSILVRVTPKGRKGKVSENVRLETLTRACISLGFFAISPSKAPANAATLASVGSEASSAKAAETKDLGPTTAATIAAQCIGHSDDHGPNELCAWFDIEPIGSTHDGPIAPPANELVAPVKSSEAQSIAGSVASDEDLPSTPSAVESSTPSAAESTAFTADKDATFPASSEEPVEPFSDPVNRDPETVRRDQSAAAEPVLDLLLGDCSSLDQIVEADASRSSSSVASTPDGSAPADAEEDGALEQHRDVSFSILIVRNAHIDVQEELTTPARPALTAKDEKAEAATPPEYEDHFSTSEEALASPNPRGPAA
ncbi:hypothetical protein JCM8115_007102 [Rhodotorula mucilaginosa]